MIDVTDSVFRQIVARCGAPDIFFSEFVSVDSLASPGKDAMGPKLQYTQIEKPLVVQVWGIGVKNFEAQCRDLASQGYAGIDINMGCPVAKVISKGACSALIKDRGLAKDMINVSKEGIESSGEKIPLSVKTRIGFDEIDLSWIEFLLEQKLDALTVHCRTVAELSKVPNHFEVLPEIVAMKNEISPQTKLIANGDITSRTQGEQLADQYGLDGVMIGRGVFSDPYVFSQTSPWSEMTPREKIKLFMEHIELFESTWQGIKNPDVLKKFAKIYINGFKGAPQIRDQVMAQKNITDLKTFLTSPEFPED